MTTTSSLRTYIFSTNFWKCMHAQCFDTVVFRWVTSLQVHWPPKIRLRRSGGTTLNNTGKRRPVKQKLRKNRDRRQITHLTASFPGQPGWAGIRKVKPLLILMRQETMGWQWHQLDHKQSFAPRSRQITTPAPHHSIFYRPDALLHTQPTVSKHWRQTKREDTYTQPFYDPFPGPPGWAGARKEPLDFTVQGKINRGRHTIWLGATPSELIRTHLHQTPIFTGWMPFLPPNQQCQSTEGRTVKSN